MTRMWQKRNAKAARRNGAHCVHTPSSRLKMVFSRP
ncbi:hypothetical protein DM50_2392 [Burkholderia mallei]|nr:hypothetical protein DM50_2392 [Burkholderia mallei]